MAKVIVRRLLVAASLLAAPLTSGTSADIVARKNTIDPRLSRLRQFFGVYGSPVAPLAEDFISASDRNGLDWRLLPSLSIIETGGGRQVQNNNIFGWANGRQRFSSVREGIHAVAYQLAHGKYYRSQRTVDRKLKTYNPLGHYAPAVKAVMQKLGPQPLAARAIAY